MTATDLLTSCRAAGIILAADGDSLAVDAPAGALTPALRDTLARHKPELLALLAPVDYVTYGGGLALPLPAVELALDLERRGFRLRLDELQQVQIEPAGGLMATDRAAIARWRVDLALAVAYDADAQNGRPQ